jgi:hypothetical protein
MRFSSQIGTVSAGSLKNIPHLDLLLILPTQAFTQRRRRYWGIDVFSAIAAPAPM